MTCCVRLAGRRSLANESVHGPYMGSIDGRNNREFKSGSSSDPRTPHYNAGDGRGRTWADQCSSPNIVMGGGGGTQNLKSCLSLLSYEF